MIPAIPASTSPESDAPMPPMLRRLIPRRVCTKRPQGKRPSSAYLGHVLRENRHGLVVDTRVTQATGTAERAAALAMAEAIPGQQRVTLGADKHDDTRDCVRELRELRVTPHVAQILRGRSSAIDGRTTRHPGYAISQRTRTCVEEILGWLKTVGLLRKATTSWRCPSRVDVHRCGRCGQLGADAHAGGSGMSPRQDRGAGPPLRRCRLIETGCLTPRAVPKILPSFIRNLYGPS